jgi:hypothetical protein
MALHLARAQYDPRTCRAYVELRDKDQEGEVIATVVFSFKTTELLSKRQIDQEIVRKARHILRKASVDLDGE